MQNVVPASLSSVQKTDPNPFKASGQSKFTSADSDVGFVVSWAINPGQRGLPADALHSSRAARGFKWRSGAKPCDAVNTDTETSFSLGSRFHFNIPPHQHVLPTLKCCTNTYSNTREYYPDQVFTSLLRGTD